MSHTSHRLERACQSSTTRRPSPPLNLVTTSWKIRNQEALETWTCKDPLCRAPHHQGQSPYQQESPTDSRSIPDIIGPRTLRPCPWQSSEDGYVAIHLPRPCMAAN